VRDVLDELALWWVEGATVAMGTVVGTWMSSPRQPGASMLVGPDGSAVASVSGGCVEGAVYEVGETVRDGAPATLERYGVSDDDAFAVGLTCGGIVDIFVQPISRQTFPEFGHVAADIRAGHPVAVATVIESPGKPLGARMIVWPDSVGGTLGSARLDEAVRDDTRGLLEQGQTKILRYGADGERRGDDAAVFVHSFAPRPRMIVFGAIDFAAAVARVGSFLGYRVTVCDARPTFATRKRFPSADEVVVDWPHHYLSATEVDSRTVLCVLTHDPEFDVPLLELALRLPVAYVGAMGSRRTNDDRGPAARTGPLRQRTGAAARAHRAGHRRPNPRRNGHLGRGGDDRQTLGRLRLSAAPG
jgi:xanthine dehydrogenase accessory factor